MKHLTPPRAVGLYATNNSNPATGYGKMELGLLRALQAQGRYSTEPSGLALMTGNPAWAHFYGTQQPLWAFTMSETTLVGPQWVQALNQRFLRCLVPTPELVKIYQDSGVTIPVDYVPLGVDFAPVPLVERNPRAALDATPEQPFIFLAYSLGDMRKDAAAAMLAFNRLFGGDLRYRMIVKCRDNEKWLAGLIDPQIEIMRGEQREAEWQALMAKCHAFLFPSRGEGFGLPPREATLNGLPTAATQWLGMWDVAAWGLPIRVKELIPAQFDEWEANAEGAQWAVADADALDEQMRFIVEHYDQALETAQRGRQYLMDNFSWERVGERLGELLDAHGDLNGWSADTDARKVAFVLGSLNPGGGETQACNLAREMKRHGLHPVVILPVGAGRQARKLSEKLLADGVPFASFHSGGDVVTRLAEVLRFLQPEMVIGVGYPVCITAALAGFKAHVPTRVSWLVSEGFEREQFTQDWVIEFAGMKAATHLVGNSAAVVESLVNYHGTDKRRAQIIPNGVDAVEPDEALRQRARAFWELEAEQVAVGLLAHFREDGIKNQMMLVRAAERIVKAYNHVVFCLAGEHSGVYAADVQAEITRLGLDPYFRMPGAVATEMIAGWDIAVNCSITEGLSNALQECMAYGLPVVATAVGGNVSLVEPVDLVESNDDDMLAARLKSYIAFANKRETAGGRNRLKMKGAYAWCNVLRQWLALMEPEHA